MALGAQARYENLLSVGNLPCHRFISLQSAGCHVQPVGAAVARRFLALYPSPGFKNVNDRSHRRWIDADRGSSSPLGLPRADANQRESPPLREVQAHHFGASLIGQKPHIDVIEFNQLVPNGLLLGLLLTTWHPVLRSVPFGIATFFQFCLPERLGWFAVRNSNWFQVRNSIAGVDTEGLGPVDSMRKSTSMGLSITCIVKYPVEIKFPEALLQRVIANVAYPGLKLVPILVLALSAVSPVLHATDGVRAIDGAQAKDVEQALRAQLESERVMHHFPGATAAFTLPNGRAGSVAVGLSDVALELPMLESSRMPAGSIGKTFVAALTLAVVAESAISLDDKLSRWLGDEAWYERLPNGADILIRNLLNHSAGIGNHLETQAFAERVRTQIAVDPRGVIEPRVLVGFILDEPALFPAGEGYAYTDTGFILLQLALEKSGGFEWGEEVMRRFLYPLQLTHTGPADGVSQPGLAQGYVNTPNPLGLPATTLSGGFLKWNPKSEWAGGGFISTSVDLAQWMAALFEGEAIPAESVAQMVSAQNTNTAAQGFSYGLGMVIEKGKWGRVWRHRGVYPGYRSSASYFPDCKVSFALQINWDRITGEALGAVDQALTDVVLNANCQKSN